MKQIVLILTFILVTPLLCNAQQKRALLVGISKYHSYGYKVWNNIHGAEDVALLTPELKKKGFTVQTLVNEQATYQGIVNSLNKLIAVSQKGDVIYLHFSCHGQPVEDGLNGNLKDEKDGWDEAVVPIDAGKVYGASGYKGDKHLTDDELNGSVSKLRKKIGPEGMLYVAMDACHAGTSLREDETIRGTNEGLTQEPENTYNPPESTIKHIVFKKGKGLAHVLYLEACKSYECNAEIIIKGEEYGSLSYNIWHALRVMPDLDKNVSEFRNNVEYSTKQKGRWPSNQTLVTESSF